MSAERITGLTDDEILALIGLINRELRQSHPRNDFGLSHTINAPGNPARTVTTDGRVLVGKLLAEALGRGLLQAPGCWRPPS